MKINAFFTSLAIVGMSMSLTQGPAQATQLS